MSHMRQEYGTEKKAEQVFYASKNAGTIKGVDAVDELDFETEGVPLEPSEHGSSRFYTTSSIGENTHFTHEGYLVCENVPLARTGTMLYGAGETEIAPGKGGIVLIERDPDVVFDPKAMLSFVGKPVCDNHPAEDVTPDNYRHYARGHVTNVHQGAPPDDGLLLGDLLIMDQELIDAIVKHKKRQVSLGYDADYIKLGPGHGKQTNIIGNHVAIVKEARCGDRCSIRDAAMGDTNMKSNASFADRLRRSFVTRDAGEFESALQEQDKDKQQPAASHHVVVNIHGAGPGGGPDTAGGGT